MQSSTVTAVANTICLSVFSIAKDGYCFCCNYLYDFKEIFKEVICSAKKWSGLCWGRQPWASLWLWLEQNKVSSLVQALGRSKKLFHNRLHIWLGTETSAGLICFAAVTFVLIPCCLYTASQNGSGWKGSLEVILSNSPAQAEPPGGGPWSQDHVQMAFEDLQQPVYQVPMCVKKLVSLQF